MPLNGSGTFSRLYNWATDLASGAPNHFIQADRMDAEQDGIATALSTALYKDGQQTSTANQPMGGFKHTNVAAGSAANDYADVASVQDGSYVWCGTATGTADAIALTPSPAVTALVTGMEFRWKASANANTGATTIAVSGLSTVAAERNDAALAAGDHAANKYYRGVYDGTAIQITQDSQAAGYSDPITTQGDVIRGSSGGAAERLALGATNTVLSSDGTDALFQTLATIGAAEITRTINSQTGTTYTLVLGDAGDIVTMSNASANTLTIPTNASVAFTVGTQIEVIMLGVGTTTVTGDTGVTVNGVSAGGADIDAQYKGVSLVKLAADTWVMVGAHGVIA